MVVCKKMLLKTRAISNKKIIKKNIFEFFFQKKLFNLLSMNYFLYFIIRCKSIICVLKIEFEIVTYIIKQVLYI